MNISVIGTGYVGLVSGVCLADKGHQVICVDKDENKVNQIRNSVSPIYEPGLDELLARNIGKTLEVVTDVRKAVLATEISIIAVGTPFNGDEIDLSFVIKAAEEIGLALREKEGYHVVVVKSTVVPGTTDGPVREALERTSGKRAGADFGLGMNPEFLREGEAIGDFMNPDRIVLGGVDTATQSTLAEMYAAFPGTDIVVTNNKTAEMIKYAANSLLATAISFSNEIGNLCSAVGGVDTKEVMRGVHLDRRLSPIIEDGRRLSPAFTTYLEAGCGFGGSCFPKDVKALIAHGVKHGQSMELLSSVMNINQDQPHQMIRLLEKHIDDLSGVRVGILGLAFKPETDDMRESPAIPIVTELLRRGAVVSAYDPVASGAARQLFGDVGISYCDDLKQCIDGSEALLLLTRWAEFERLPELLKEANISPIVIDGRRMLARDSVPRYEGIGLA